MADDDHVSRRLLSGLLEQTYEILAVEDGADAVQSFARFDPDIVILDVDMPRLDGVGATTEIKRLAGDRFVPVILVSRLEAQPTLMRALSVGADDFFTKPVNPKVLRTRLDVLLKIKERQDQLLTQNRSLENYQHQTRAEHELASQMFERMMKRAAPDDERLRISLSSLDLFNGDAVFAATTKENYFRLVVADVAGHGLRGALGTLALSALFYSAIERGERLLASIELINRELTIAWPTQLFCSAVILELDRFQNKLTLINAGMPSVYVLGRCGVREFTSHNVPLGVTRDYFPVVESIDVSLGDVIFAMSDGVVESRSPSGEIFGSDRVLKLLEVTPVDCSFDSLLAAIVGFAQRQADDVSLVQLRV